MRPGSEGWWCGVFRHHLLQPHRGPCAGEEAAENPRNTVTIGQLHLMSGGVSGTSGQGQDRAGAGHWSHQDPLNLP